MDPRCAPDARLDYYFVLLGWGQWRTFDFGGYLLRYNAGSSNEFQGSEISNRRAQADVSLAVADVVRRARTCVAVAREPRPVPSVAIGDHAAADTGGGG